MLDSDEDFDRALRVLRNVVGIACCLVSGALIVAAYGGWRLLVAMLLLYWPFQLATDLGSRRNWYGRARAALAGRKMLWPADILAVAAIVLGPTLIAQYFRLDMGPAALGLVLSAALAALWLEPSWQGSVSPAASSCSNIL